MPARPLPMCALALLLAPAMTACGGCDPCVPPEDTALDYAEQDAWVCQGPGSPACRDGLEATAVLADGSFRAVPFVPADDPPIDCFYVYPTVDLALGRGVHDDFRNTASQRRTVQAQAARLGTECAVYAPLYRQATLGTYLTGAKEPEVCWDLAFSDVTRAFEHYLEHLNLGRGVVLVGHSQGGQNTSRLLREFFDGGKVLADRLVAAMPLGWAVATAAGERAGGSFEKLPLCHSDDELGCVVAYRSYAKGNELPLLRDNAAPGEQVACTNPVHLGSDTAERLRGAYLATDLTFVQKPQGLPANAADTLLYQDLFTARCVTAEGQDLLEVAFAPRAGDLRVNPVNFDAPLLSGVTGTHMLDVQLLLGDLIELVRIKGAAYLVEHPRLP